MGLARAVKISLGVTQKVLRISKTIFKPKATEVWLDRGIKREINYRGKHSIDATKCLGCGMCARTCPVSCIEMVPTGLKKPRAIPQIRLNECIFCGLCRDVCPAKAITMTHDYRVYAEPGTWENIKTMRVKAKNLDEAIEKAKRTEEATKLKKEKKE